MKRKWISIFIGILLFASMLYTSYLFSENGIHGIAHTVTSEMLGFIGWDIGNNIYTLMHIGKLKK